MKRILGKVQEMREQRGSLEKQLRELIQQDDITSTLVTTERADMKVCGCPVFSYYTSSRRVWVSRRHLS